MAAPRVLIAGVGGIGGALARRLYARKVPIHLIGRNSDKLAYLALELGGAPYSVADAAKPEAFAIAVKEIAEMGPLSGLVYAIGSIPLKSLKATSASDFIDAYNLNVVSGALALKAASGALGARGASHPGSAVFFSTVAAALGFPMHTAIASAKGGVEAFVRSAAAELSPTVRVNAIAPSLTDTPLASRLLASDAARRALGDAHPLPRVGTADELAAVTEFLLGNDSSWVSGQVWRVDGGRSTLRPKN